MATVIQLKRGVAASWLAWEAADPANRLAIGEVGLLLDGLGAVVDVKVGDGTNTWANLDRNPVYWDQIQDPREDSEIEIAQSQVVDLVDDLEDKAPLDSPEFTGTPTGPTAATGTFTDQLATTEYVINSRIKPDWDAEEDASNEILNKPDLSLKANLASPTLTGTPVAPTAPTGTSTTQLATTAFVQAARIKPDWSATLGAVNEILNKPTNATTSVAGFMSAADKTKLDGLGFGLLQVDWEAPEESTNSIANKPDLSLKANLASPALTGIPTAPTAATGVNSTQVATTAFVRNLINENILEDISLIIDGGGV